MNEVVSEYKFLIMAVCVVIALAVYISSDDQLKEKVLRAISLRKKGIDQEYDFGFIEAPNIMELTIKLEDVMDLESASTIQESANIIWRYEYATEETQMLKDDEDYAVSILNEIEERKVEAKEEMEVAEGNQIYLKRESEEKLGTEYNDYLEPGSESHVNIPDDFELAEESKKEEEKEWKAEDFDDMGENQEL